MKTAAALPLIPCFGIRCDVHQNCRCYEAIEFSDADLRIGLCAQDEEGNRLRFIPIKPV